MRAGYLKPVRSSGFVPSEVDLLKLATFPNLSMNLEFVCSVVLHLSSSAILVSIHVAASIDCGCQGQFLLMAYVGSFTTVNHISGNLRVPGKESILFP